MIKILTCIVIAILLIYCISTDNFTHNTWKCDPYANISPEISFSLPSKSRCYNGDVEPNELDNFNQSPESRECPEGSEKISAQDSSNSLNKGFCR